MLRPWRTGGEFFGTEKAILRCRCRHRTSSKRRRSSPAGDKLSKKRYIIAEPDARSAKGPKCELGVVVREIRVASVVDG